MMPHIETIELVEQTKLTMRIEQLMKRDLEKFLDKRHESKS